MNEIRKTFDTYNGEERIGAYRVLVGKPEGKRTLVRTKRKWENNIQMDVQEGQVGYGLDRSDLR